MKAIFAVTALAAAISTQALAADTETTFEYAGVVDVYMAHDFENEVSSVSYYDDAADDDDDAGYGLSLDLTVTNGPFSGVIEIELQDDANGEPSLDVEDLLITEGNLQAGQVGSLMSTDEYTADMQAGNTVDEAIGIVAGIKYMVAEGLYVQVQGTQADDADDSTETYYDYGFAAQYAGSVDALSYVVEAEIQLTDDQSYDDDGDEVTADSTIEDQDEFTFVGAGVTYTADNFELIAAINITGGDEENTEFGISATTDVAGFSLSAAYTEYDSDESDNELIELYAGYSVSETVTAGIGYDYDTVQDSGDTVYGSLAYAEGMVGAEVEVGMEHLDADDQNLYIDAEVVYTVESGVEFYGEFDWNNGDYDEGDKENSIAAGVRYAF